MNGGEASKVWFCCSVLCAAPKVSCEPSSSPRTSGKARGRLALGVGAVGVPRHLAGPRSVEEAAEEFWVGAAQASEQVRFQKEKLGWSRTGTEKVEAGALGLGKWV